MESTGGHTSELLKALFAPGSRRIYLHVDTINK